MLTVYRASAGSGKTYQLTGEYLKLLFSGSGSFRHILAVTFTNKATDEMKSRIVKELDNLAGGVESSFIGMLTSEFSISEKSVRERAHRILLEILHDYSSFNISTIDRFFQQTMRAFAREIGLQGGYNVELDTSRILIEAIDRMLLTLDAPENSELLGWLLRFSEEKIENGNSWNFNKDVVELGGELFKEKYKRLSNETHNALGDKEALRDYLKKMDSIVSDFESKVVEIGKKGLFEIGKSGFHYSDFSGGASRSPLKLFEKWSKRDVVLPTNTFSRLADNIEDWKSATKSNHLDVEIKKSYHLGLNDCVKQALKLFDSYSIYNSAKLIRRNIYSLGILSDIDKRIKEIVAENNLMLLSDTTHLLNKLIDGSDTPFIYEKIGVRMEHFMIDEFQDTSLMQWQNFSPLIHESLATKNSFSNKLSNLIVGDVKQSIYRWRGSDWKLLDEQIEREFGARVREKVLDDNWRSGSAIVGFNNAFFTIAAGRLAEKFREAIPDSAKENQAIVSMSDKIQRAYKDVYQNVPKEKKDESGYVKIQWFEENTWKEDSLNELVKIVEGWLLNGYSLRDIAILVRTNDEGSQSANKLLENGIAVISDEALLLRNASSVKLVIALLKLIRRPNDLNLKRLAAIEYAERVKPFENSVGEFFEVVEGDFVAHFSADKELELEFARRMPLFEMCQRLIATFIESPSETDNLYLQTFQDLVLDFTTRRTADLIAFLDWWDESGSNKRVLMPDSQDAVRIMTIHKSKGLGFKAVVVPFCDWSLDSSARTLLWCTPAVEPFNSLPLIPLAYTNDLGNSIFSMDFFEEKLHAFVDNLNVAYVAFTRAKEKLVVFSPKPKKDNTSRLGGLLYDCMSRPNLPVDVNKPFIHLNEKFVSELIYEDGLDFTPNKSSEKGVAEEAATNIRSVNPDGRLQLKLKSREFFIESLDQKYGKLMHNILSKIRTAKDIQIAVSTLVNSGEIQDSKGVEIVSRLTDCITHPSVKDWFSDQVNVLNEIEILMPDNKRCRPDRVIFIQNEVHVIDFKFGQVKSKKYQHQVATYVDIISKMGFNSVKGFLWYVELNEVEEIL